MKNLAMVAVLLHCTVALAADPHLGRAARNFPDTSERIVVYVDQLPSQLSEAQWKFVATHYVGGQKQTRDWVRKIRRLNPDLLMLHYQLALGTGPAKFVVGDEWVNDFDKVDKHEDWFIRDAAGHRLLQKHWNWYVMDIRFAGGKPASGFPQYWTDAALDRMRANEDDGTFADSYTQDVLMRQLEPAKFPWFSNAQACKTEWLPQLNAYGGFVQQNFQAAPEKFYFLPNLGGLITCPDLAEPASGANRNSLSRVHAELMRWEVYQYRGGSRSTSYSNVYWLKHYPLRAAIIVVVFAEEISHIPAYTLSSMTPEPNLWSL